MTTEKFHLLGKRKHDCALCGYPVWAYVDTNTDEYYLDCVCGPTEIIYGYSNYKASFLYANGVEATGCEM